MTPSGLSPHGLRAGFITEAYLHGALDEQVQQHARQKSIATTRRYRQRAKVVAARPGQVPLLDLRAGRRGVGQRCGAACTCQGPGGP